MNVETIKNISHSLILGLFLLTLPVFVRELPGDDFAGAFLEELEELEQDYHLLGDSCRLELRHGAGVDGAFQRGGKTAETGPATGWKWDSANEWLVPVRDSNVAATGTVSVPAAGKYRVWLRRHVRANERSPVKLKLSGANSGEFLYGTKPLGSEPLRGQEAKLRFRAENREMRDAMFVVPAWIWEYHDLELAAGDTVFAISAESAAARISTVFMSRSLSFTPNRGNVAGQNNLDRIYYRFRVPAGARGAVEYSFGRKSVTYHWRWRPRGFEGQFYWYCSLPQAKNSKGGDNLRRGEWSDWVDATFNSTGAGPWFTLSVVLNGVMDGQLEIELAWFTDPHTVLRRTRTKIFNGRALLALPAHLGRIDYPVPDEDNPAVSGMIRQEFLDNLRSAKEMHQDFIRYAEEAVAALGLPADHPRPQRLRLLSHATGVVETEQESTARLLSLLGVSESSISDRDALKKHGLRRSLRLAYSVWAYLAASHDPADPVIPFTIDNAIGTAKDSRLENDPYAAADLSTVLIGDEIGPVVSAAGKINNSSDSRAHFRAWLAEVLRQKGETPAYFGVDDLRLLDYLERKPDVQTRFARRLYYHSQIYKYVLSADYYRHTMNAVHKQYPGTVTYANFTPASAIIDPPQHMNNTDWFSLPRLHGASMAWGECWASGGRWGYLGMEIVSYYAAWVQCAARRHNLPTGFYAVLTNGSPEHKIMSLVSRGIDLIDLYTFGPVYAGADAVNYWSDTPRVYNAIVRATYALGPADTIIAEGTQPPRKVALLYNRTHEIWNAGPYGMQCDRACTFAALVNAHYNPDIILVEDLTSEHLAPYSVLFLNGFNLPAESATHLRQWVEQGGLLIGTVGVGSLDEYNQPMDAVADIFGAAQLYAASSSGRWAPYALDQHQPLTTLTLRESELTPALEVPLIGSMAVLNPKGGTPVGTFADGSCAAVSNRLGKGRTLLYGFQPGTLYKGDSGGFSRYLLERAPLIVKPVAAALGQPRLTINAPQTELTLFEHETGLAITLNNFAFRDWNEELPPAVITLHTDRKIESVTASLAGPLSWNREGAVIRITMPVPKNVDVIVLK